MTQFNYQVGDEIKTVTIERDGDRFRAVVGDAVYTVVARLWQPGEFDLEVNGQRLRAHVAHDESQLYVAVAGNIWTLKRSPSPRQRRGIGHSSETGSLEATMPGLVLDVLTQDGAEVARGDTLVILEAMKMELRLTAPYAGRVRRVYCTAGQVVERGQVLVEMKEGEI